MALGAAVATGALALAIAAPAFAGGNGGVTQPAPPPPGKPNAEEAPTTTALTAKIRRDGTALAPERAPDAVKQMIAAANRISRKPYRWGGGHRRWWDKGYDCSGAVSYALYGAGLVESPLDSRGFMRWGEPGEGQWVTVYTNPGHAYIVIAGVRFDTGYNRRGRGPRWSDMKRPSRGFKRRHPEGL